MDAQLLAYIKLYQNDLNALPYKIYQLGPGGTKEFGNFIQATASELGTVTSWGDCLGSWYPGCSAFLAVWIALMKQGSPSLLKLYSNSDPTMTLQGLVHLDLSKPCEDKSARVLETAPHNQAGTWGRKYSGVGKALVARLVLECYLTGQQTLFIRVHPRNIGFYRSLHFIQSPQFPGRMALNLQDAEQFLRNFFF